eukprot:s811_g26.t1
MLGSNERQQIIAEEEAKAKAQAEAQGGSSSSSSAMPKAASKSAKKKKSSPALQHEATQSSPAVAKLVGSSWEIIPPGSAKISVPAMPTSPSSSSAEEHRPNLRELVKQEIKELEFKVALELFASVARLVTKD